MPRENRNSLCIKCGEKIWWHTDYATTDPPSTITARQYWIGGPLHERYRYAGEHDDEVERIVQGSFRYSDCDPVAGGTVFQGSGSHEPLDALEQLVYENYPEAMNDAS